MNQGVFKFWVWWFIFQRIIATKQPNIIVMVVDDWGWNDVPYHNNTDTQAPTIDSLAKSGIILDRHYVLPQCTPSRAALLTGRHPIRVGLQHQNLGPADPFALTLKETLLPQYFQNNGYSTHMIGKWHLGYCAWEYTPTKRGFETFAGYYNGEIDYFKYNVSDSRVGFEGKDLRAQEECASELVDKYSVEWQSEQLENLISTWEHQDKPFFTYVAWQASHYPSQGHPKFLDLYANSTYQYERKSFQSRTSSVDTYLESFINKLKNVSLWDDTLLVFFSDNGAGCDSGDNSPLRGAKLTIWEGGIRVPAFVAGGYLNDSQRGKTIDSKMHITDWLPTLLTAAGISTDELRDLDGMDMWELIQKGTTSTDIDNRTILVNIDSYQCSGGVCGAVIWDNYKLVWSTNQLFDSGANKNTKKECFWTRGFALDNTTDTLGCGELPDDLDLENCIDCGSSPCLFDLSIDPCEYYDVSDSYPGIVKTLKDVLLDWNDTAILPFQEVFTHDNRSDPSNFDGWWTPFLNASEVEFEEWIRDVWTISTETMAAKKSLTLHAGMDITNKKENSLLGSFNSSSLWILSSMIIMIIIYLSCNYFAKKIFNKTSAINLSEITPLIRTN